MTDWTTRQTYKIDGGSFSDTEIYDIYNGGSFSDTSIDTVIDSNGFAGDWDVRQDISSIWDERPDALYILAETGARILEEDGSGYLVQEKSELEGVEWNRRQAI